jgi:aquaporin Z
LSVFGNGYEKNTGMKKCAAEFMGTFGLVFFGTGASVVNEITKGTITHAGVAVTWGLIVMAMIYTFGDKSGSHLNPAVTIAFAAHKVFPRRLVFPYLISQVAGAVAASGLLKFLFPASRFLGATLPSGSEAQSFVLEIILTFFLMTTALNVSEGGKEKGLFAGLAVGAVVLLEAMFAGLVSGASMNPARSLAPAIFNSHFTSLWIYLTAPFMGALAAVGIHRLIK